MAQRRVQGSRRARSSRPRPCCCRSDSCYPSAPSLLSAATCSRQGLVEQQQLQGRGRGATQRWRKMSLRPPATSCWRASWDSWAPLWGQRCWGEGEEEDEEGEAGGGRPARVPGSRSQRPHPTRPAATYRGPGSCTLQAASGLSERARARFRRSRRRTAAGRSRTTAAGTAAAAAATTPTRTRTGLAAAAARRGAAAPPSSQVGAWGGAAGRLGAGRGGCGVVARHPRRAAHACVSLPSTTWTTSAGAATPTRGASRNSLVNVQ